MKSCIDDLSILVIGKSDSAAVCPIKVLVGIDESFSVFTFNFKLHPELRFRTVLVFDSPSAAGATVKPVSEKGCYSILALANKLGYVVGLILKSLFIVGNTGGENEIAHPFSVDTRLIKTAGGGVKSCLFNLSCREYFSEAINGVPFIFVYLVVSRDPFSLEILRGEESHLEESITRLSLSVTFIPKGNTPFDPLAGMKLFWIYRLHRARVYLAAVPYGRAIYFRHNAIGGLLFATLAVPSKERMLKINADRIGQKFCF